MERGRDKGIEERYIGDEEKEDGEDEDEGDDDGEEEFKMRVGEKLNEMRNERIDVKKEGEGWERNEYGG